VKEATAITKTAFILPCVENQGDQFPLTHDFFFKNEWIDIWSEDVHGD
jgi:hypothetical protein